MRLGAALVVGFVATTAAFLIPPQTADVVKDARFEHVPQPVKDLLHSLLEDKTETIDLACPNCPGIAESGRGEEKAIRIELTTKDKGLQINGQTVFPFSRASSNVKASQVLKGAHEPSEPEPINFALEAFQPHQAKGPGHFELLPLDFTILGINGQPVKVPTLSIKLIKTPDDSFVVVKTEQIPFKDTPGAQECESARLWTMCRIKAIVAARLQALIAAAKHSANKVQGWASSKSCGKHRPYNGVSKPHDKDAKRPHGHHQHHGHGHNGHYRAARVIHRVLEFFIIPALLGIMGGLAASAIGMLVGQTLVWLWCRSYRRHQGSQDRIVLVEEVIVEDEKDGLLVTEETLPAYSDTETILTTDRK